MEWSSEAFSLNLMYFAGHRASLKLFTERPLVLNLPFLVPKSKNNLHFRIFHLMFVRYLMETELCRLSQVNVLYCRSETH